MSLRPRTPTTRPAIPGRPAVHHATDDHGDEHGHDDHAHAEEPLGPIDVGGLGCRRRSGVLVGVVIGGLLRPGYRAALTL